MSPRRVSAAGEPSFRAPAWRRVASLGLLALLVAITGACAGALRDDWSENPHGRFGDEALAASSRPAAPAAPRVEVPAVPAPLDDGVGEGAGARASAAAPGRSAGETRGPVTPEELAAVGIELGVPDFTTLRGTDWRPKGRLGYRAARDAFLARSPGIAAAVEAYRKSFTRFDQVDYVNDLVRQYDAFAGELRTGATTPLVHADIRKRFPLGGVVALQGELVAVDVATSKVQLQRRILEGLVRFEQAWQGARYWQRAVTILGRTLELAERVADAAGARYRAGQTTHANLIQAQIRATDLRERLTTARGQRAAARRMLATLIDLDPENLARTRLRLDAPLPRRPRRSEARDAARRAGPQVESARLARERAVLLVQLAERQLLPNLSDGSSHVRRGTMAPPRGDIPYATGGPFLQEMRHGLVGAGLRLDEARRDTPARADALWVVLDDALRMRRINAGTQSERATLAVEVAEQGYRAGTATFFDLDAAVRLFLEISLKAESGLRDAFIAAARLQVVVGPTGAARAGEGPDEATERKRER